MKDICEACELSRGGLYRHYGSTQEILEEIFKGMSGSDLTYVKEQIAEKISAKRLLKEILERMQAEMLDQERSLSYAIYEYSALCGNGFLTEQNLEARENGA